MTNVQRIFEVLFRVAKKGTGDKATVQSLKEVDKEQKKATKSSKALTEAQKSLGTVLGAVTVGAVLRQTAAFVEQGIEIERAEMALMAFVGTEEEVARTTEEMQMAAGRAISRMTAMQQAARLLSMGLADNADEAAHLTNIATTLGAAMGKGPNQAIEELTLLLANQSILRLDTFGVSGARVRDRMKELQAATEGMNRETAFLTAFMEEAEGKMDLLAEAGFEATSSVDRMKAIIEDTKAGIATFLSDGLVPLIDGFFLFTDAVKEHRDEMLSSEEGIERLRAKLENMPPTYAAMARAELEAAEEQLRLNESMQTGAMNLEAYRSQAQSATGATGELEEETDKLRSVYGKAEEAAKDFFASVDTGLGSTLERQIKQIDLFAAGGGDLLGAQQAITSALDAGKITPSQAKEMYSEVFLQWQNLQVDMGELDLSEARKEVSEAFGIPIWEATQQLKDMEGQQFRTKLIVDVITEGWPEGVSAPGFQHGGSFIVGGPPGPDRTPVAFMASRGEQVTITRPGQASPTQNVLQGATINITSDLTARAFGNLFERFVGA